MKKAILSLATVLMTFAAQAKPVDTYYVLDMTGRHFSDQYFNEMDDGIEWDENMVGYAMRLDGVYDKDFIVIAKPAADSEPQVTCAVSLWKKDSKHSYVIMHSEVETDTGETCEYNILYEDGRQATVMVFNEGT